MITLHDYILSSDGYKVRLLLRMLERPFQTVKVDVHPGREQQGSAFLAINPLGTLPVLEEDGLRVWDAQAILSYLALRHDPERRWLPADPALAAQVAMWLAFAGRELGAPSRLRMAAITAEQLPGRAVLEQTSLRAFDILDDHLAERAMEGTQWLVGDAPTIADIAAFPPVALAADAGLPLEGRPALWRWMGAVKRLPRFSVMPGVLPVDLAEALAG